MTHAIATKFSKLLLYGALTLSFANTAVAQSPEISDAAQSEASSTTRSLFEVVFSGGWTGTLIVLVLVGLSLFVAALVIEHSLTIREAVLMPPRLAERVRGSLMSGDVRAADEACQAEPSFLAFVLRAGMAEATEGWSAVEKSLEDATAEQAARLFRKIEFLSVMGNIAPMVGLLGTVTGMIFAFQEVAESQGAARAAELAEGIYQALVTTVGGLLIAIPSLAAFAVFRNRVDGLVAETAYQSLHALAPLKRRHVPRGEPAPPPSGGPPAPPPVQGGV